MVSSGGSIVREIMFPGSDHEMTNVYHMDGESLVMTHFCATGNQPRMRATAAPKAVEGGTSLHFDFDGVSNLRAEHGGYMGAMTFTFLDDGDVRQHWQRYDSSGAEDGTMTFLLRRAR